MTPGPPGFSRPTLAQPAGRQPGTDSPPGPSGRVQPAKFPTARSGLRPRTGHMCCPEGAVTSLLPLMQGGTAAPRPSLCFPRCTNSARERLRLPSPGVPAGRHARPGATGRRLPWRPPCFAPGAGGCRTLSAAHFPSGRQRGWRYSPAACAPGLPPHSLPPARVMRAPPAHWLRPARAGGARVIRRPLPCGRGGPGSGGGGRGART